MKNSTDIVVHINEKLGKKDRLSLTSKINGLKGVVSVRLGDQRPHLLIVGFNPEKTKSLNVLSGVQNSGVHAQLIGWL